LDYKHKLSNVVEHIQDAYDKAKKNNVVAGNLIHDEKKSLKTIHTSMKAIGVEKDKTAKTRKVKKQEFPK